MPEWRWRTFPVYFALAAGFFIGVYAGGITASTSGVDSDAFFIVLIIAAMLLGFGLSRLMVRLVITRRLFGRR
jgi:hypothetical protein